MIKAKELLQKIESGDVSYEDKLAALGQVETALKEMRERKETILNDRVGMIIDALKTMQAKVAAQLEEAKAIVPEIGPQGPKGERGLDGRDGANGRDGRDGVDGANGRDGADGVSVTDAKIDFDGSLVITLSTGREINVGEVVAPELAEKIKLVTSGGGTSQAVLDAIAAIEATIATYGTMALQNANNVAITGGSINNTAIGNTTPNAATFTTLTATGQTSLGGAAGSDVVRIYRDNTIAGGTASFTAPAFALFPNQNNYGAAVFRSTGQLQITTGSSSPINLATAATLGFAGVEQLRVSHTASAVNYVQVTGAATGARARISIGGSDATSGMALDTKGSGSFFFTTNGNAVPNFAIFPQDSPTNYYQVRGVSSGQGPMLAPVGSDTNIASTFQSKGTGAINLAPGSSGVNISNGGTVTAITRTANGSGYTSAPTATISAPTTAGGVQATATAFINMQGAQSVANGGTGYTVNDTLTVVGGTPSGGAATVTVTGVSGGVITSVAVAAAANYTTAPTNPASVTGGTGTGATLNLAWALSTTFTITNAGSGYVEQPTVTFSGGGGSGAAAYATVGSGTTVRSLGSTFSFSTPGGEQVRINDSGGTVASYVFFGGSSGGDVSIGGNGSVANVNILYRARGTGGAHRFFTNDNNNEQMRVAGTASAVNYVQVTGAATTGAPAISAQGSDSAISLQFQSKGTGLFRFRNGSNQTAFTGYAPSGAANFVGIQSVASGSAPILGAEGSDTNIDLTLTPKGTGLVRFGTYTGTALSIAGYVEIKDSAGNIRKLAVVA